MNGIQIMQNWFEEVWNNGDVDHIEKYMSATCCVSGLGGPDIHGPNEFREFHKGLNSGLSNIQCTILKIVENNGDVSGHLKVNATHRTTGIPVEFNSGFFVTIKKGKIVDAMNTVNFLDVLVQINAVSPDFLDKNLS